MAAPTIDSLFTKFNGTEIGDSTVNPTIGPKFSPAQWWFGQIFPWFIIVFGTIGNCLVLFVLSHQKYSKISTCYYMKALALSDNFVMILLFVRWLSRVPSSPLKMNTAFCVGYFFPIRLGFGMSAWTLMFMTVDRFISVKWPLKASDLCTIKRARIMLFVIALVHIIGHMPYLWRYFDPNSTTLSGQCPYALSAEFKLVYKFVRMLIFDRVLPWLLTLGFTIAMSVELYRDLKRSKEMLGDTYKTKGKLSRRVTAMSLIVSWVFFFLTFPVSIDYTIRVIHYANGNDADMFPFLYDLWVYLLYLNSALNFYLYVSASGKFREDFKVMTLTLFGVDVTRVGARGSLSASSRRTNNRISNVGQSSSGHKNENSNLTAKKSIPSNGAEYKNPEFTHL